MCFIMFFLLVLQFTSHLCSSRLSLDLQTLSEEKWVAGEFSLKMRWQQHIPPLRLHPQRGLRWGTGRELTRSGPPSAKGRTWPAFLPLTIQGVGLYVGSRGVTSVSGVLSPASPQIHVKLATADNALGSALGQTIGYRRPSSWGIICTSAKLAKNSSVRRCDERRRNLTWRKAFLSCLCSPRVCGREQVEHVNQTCSEE